MNIGDAKNVYHNQQTGIHTTQWLTTCICIFCSFHAFVVTCWLFFKITFFQKNLSGALPECQTVWIQIRINGPDLGPNRSQRISAVGKSRKHQGNWKSAQSGQNDIWLLKVTISFHQVDSTGIGQTESLLRSPVILLCYCHSEAHVY